MSEESQEQHPSGLARPAKYYMPEDYDFTNKHAQQWSYYNPFFRLRTDAVWEKSKLKDWFRSFYKNFIFNARHNRYYTVQPDETYFYLREPESFDPDQIYPFTGYSVTGATTSFQPMLGQRDTVQTSFQQYYSMSDYYLLCSLRFEKWAKCEQSIEELSTAEKYKNYPCYQEYFETNYACSDSMIEHLLELQYVRSAAGINGDEYHNVELIKPPGIYDSPHRQQRRPYSY